jgi:hypothetical protein
MSAAKEPSYIVRRNERKQQRIVSERAERDSAERKNHTEALRSLKKEIKRHRKENNEASAKKEPRERSTLRAAWVAAGGAGAAAVFSLASIGVFYTLTLKTDRTAQRAIKMAENQIDEMRAEQRPWMEFEYDAIKVESPLHFENNTGYLTISVMTKNVGHLPARFVSITGDMFTCSCKLEEIDKSWGKCEKMRDEASKNDPTGKTVFPSDEHLFKQVYMFTTEQIKMLQDKIDNKRPAGIIIIACIDYRIENERSRHYQTRIVRELDRNGPTENTLRLPNPRDGDIAINDIAIAENPIIGETAE